MHILLIHQAFAALNEPGGTRHYELACYLTGLGHRVTVIASPVSYLTGTSSARSAIVSDDNSTASESRLENDQDAKPSGLTILRAYTYPALHRSFFHRVISFFSFMTSSFWIGLKVRQVDLVWGTSPPIFQGVTAWALARLKRAPFLFEVRDLWPAFAIGVGVLRQPVLIRASEWLERFLYSHAERVMVNSPGFVAHVQVRGARQVDLIPNGADPRMFDPQADGSAFRQANRLEGRFIALYAGAHGMSNDLGIVLQAADLLKDLPEVVVLLLGDGKEKSALKAQAVEMELGNVLFLPPVPKADMGQVLAAADACIAILKPIPLYATVYPNKVFDYMAAGRPVVLAIDGVIREVVEEAEAGIFVSPGDPHALAEAIRCLVKDPDKGHTLGINGRKYVETHFDRAVLAERLARLFQEMHQE